MHRLRSIRRVALGAALTGAAIGAVPALASAATSCSYSSSAGGVVTVNADPKVHDMALSVVGKIIAVRTDATPETLCTGSGTFGLTTNTNRIQVFHDGSPLISVDYRIDLSRGDYASNAGAAPESDGNSELETTIFTDAPSSTLSLIGTPQRDVIRVGGDKRTDVNFGADNDIDFTITGRSKVIVSGDGGDDTISGNGNPNGIPGPSTALLHLFGGDGNDNIQGGSSRDTISGGPGVDSIQTLGGGVDAVDGGSELDDAVVDPIDTPITGVESITKVGHLRLAPRVLMAEAGETTRLKMSWKHPKAWRELRKVTLSVYRGKEAVGRFDARPASGRLTDKGAIDLMSGSKLSHHGKWVTAKLALRVPKSLAGENLRVDVRATDRDGHRQLERNAGSIRVAK